MKQKILSLILTGLFISVSTGQNCNNNWTYRVPITVNNSGSSTTGLQVKLTVNTSTPIAGSKMNSAGNDIRFADANCNNLPYWIESGINTASTIIWVKTGTLANGNNTIFMYYGNSSATAASDGTATFDFFDDFSGSSLNASKWTTRGTFSALSVSGGALNLQGNFNWEYVRSNTSFSTRVIVEATAKVGFDAGIVFGFTGTDNRWSFDNIASTSLNYTVNDPDVSGGASGYSTTYPNVPASTSTFQKYEIDADLNSSSLRINKFCNNTTANCNNTATTMTLSGYTGSSFYVGFTNWNTGLNLVADDIRVRQYTANTITLTYNSEVFNPLINVNRTVQNDGVYNTTVSSICGGTPYVHNLNIRATLVSATITFEMSDASGSFSSPVTIASFSGQSGSFNNTDLPFYLAYWPNNLPYGTGYKYRVKIASSSFNYTGDPSSFTNTLGATPISPSFTINNSVQCDEKDAFVYTGSSSIAAGNSSTYSWNFGDATSATGNPANKSYATYGNYTVTMKVYNSSMAACSTTVAKTVTVHPQPSAGISAGDDCQSSDHLFVGSWASGIAYGYIASYDWDFGDGNTANGDFQYHKYATYGNYTVACDGKDVQFRSNSTLPSFGGSKLSSYYWEFGDLGQDNDKNPKHLYSSAGSYSVFQRVYSTYGCWDTLRKTITVNPAVKANFTVTNVCKGVTPTIANLSAVPSGTLTYFWNLGNNTTSTATVPTPSYSQQGNYNIKLIATANTGCKDSSNKDVIIYGLPTAQFSSNPVCDNKSVDFINYSVGNASNKWTLYTGVTATTTNASYAYPTDGTYPVKLVVTTVDGCKDSITNNAVVHPLPVINFNVNSASNCLRLNNYNFVNNSTINTGTANYTWEFGDNTIATTTNASHVYAKPGSYTVKLSAVSDKGCTNSKTTANAAIVYPHPVAKFTANNACAGTNIAFTNGSAISSGSITGHAWNFGDATNATSASPSKSYSSAGTYAVQLIETSNQGCKDTTAQNVTAWPNPTVSFTATDECIGIANRFTNGSSVSSGFMASYNWTFGDASSGSDINPIHMYDEEGAYTVNLNASTDKGCTGSASKTVNVWPKPVANFTATNVCFGLANSFTNTSTISAGSIASNNWDFGDNATATTQNASHNYTAAGVYNVKLNVASDKGCTDNITKPVKVFKQPTAHIGASTYKTNVLEPTVTFTDNSLFGDYSNWDFGFHGRTSTFNYDTCAYTKPGSYKVTLKSTTVDGCESKDTTYIKVDNAFTIFFPNAFTPNGDKLNEGFGAVGVFEGINTYSLNILDGKGRVIFSTTDVNKKWNGKIENTGDELPAGNFAWFAEYTDYLGKTHKVNGLVSIRR